MPISAVEFLLEVFGPTSDPIFICSLPNNKEHKPGEVPFVIPRGGKAGPFPSFLRKWDGAGRGTYFCVSTIRRDAQPERPGGSIRSKANVSETAVLHLDLDYAAIVEDPGRILEVLGELELPPSAVVHSGFGLHCYWLLKEPINDQGPYEAVLRGLADRLGGDPAVCHAAALMRLPGTHNTKRGAHKLVDQVEHLTDFGRRYDFADLEDWLGRLGVRLHRKDDETKPVLLQDNAYVRGGREQVIQPGVDVEALIAAMAPGNVHATQRSVSASLIARGHAAADVVAFLLEATRKAIGDAPWDWRKEEQKLEDMCATAGRKFAPEQQTGTDGGGATVHNLNEERAERVKAKLEKDKENRGKPKPIDLGIEALAKLSGRGLGLLKVVDEDEWRYRRGLWRSTPAKGWLGFELETTLVEMGWPRLSTTRFINEAREWILRQTEILREDVPWDEHGMVAVRSGRQTLLIDPRSWKTRLAEADDYCTWRVESEHDPEASCPIWERLLASTFFDRPDVPDFLAELCGAGLLTKKERGLSQALVLVGGPNSGKSTVLDVLARLSCPVPNATDLSMLENPHGRMEFLTQRPWLLHEAFDQGAWYPSSFVKAVITGEPISINVKNGPIVSRSRFGPIYWGSNSPPQFKEASGAIADRFSVLHCHAKFERQNPIGVALEAQAAGFKYVYEYVLARERAGILNWALAGLRRALERGFLPVLPEAEETSRDLIRSGNIVLEFIEQCCAFDPDHMLAPGDFRFAHAVWWGSRQGDERRSFSENAIGRALTALHDDRIGRGEDFRRNYQRFIGGLRLNEEGLRLFGLGLEIRAYEQKKADASSSAAATLVEIPLDWAERGGVKAMRAAQARFNQKRSDACDRGSGENLSRDTKEVTDPRDVTNLSENESSSYPIDPTGETIF